MNIEHRTSNIEHRMGEAEPKCLVAVAMSGGKDSSAVAALLKEEGHDVVGLSARMCTGARPVPADDDIERAGRVAEMLGIAHHVVDVSPAFERHVIDYFVSEYGLGRTPSPCVVCNRYVKFGALYEHARALGAATLATGHYARVVCDEAGLYHLFSGVDPAKDQAYFLFCLDQSQLARTIFPLGTRCKRDVTAYVRKLDLPCRESRESTDLCFAPTRAYAPFVSSRRPDLARAGDLVTVDGKKLGTHRGIHNFTVGQRRGLGVATGVPMYVVRIEPAANRVVLGPRSHLMRARFDVDGVTWICGQEPAQEAIECITRIRSSQAGTACRVVVRGPTDASVEFSEAQFGVTPGQAAVFYSRDGSGEVLGGGWITACCAA